MSKSFRRADLPASHSAASIGPDAADYEWAKQIINLLKEIAARRDCINIQWQTPDFNEPAIRFYKRNQAKGLDKIRFTLSLT